MSTPPERHPEDLIARVLTGLRETQPSPGMDDRILHALQLHTAEAPSAETNAPAIRLVRAIGRLPIAAALTIALLVAVLVALRPHRAPHTTAHLSQPQSAPTAPPLLGCHSCRESAFAFAARRPRPRTLALTPTTPTDPEAAEALADTLAPSHPAPPLPLTPQEKLLLRVLQRNDPVELAQLDPLVRDAALARDQAAFQKFFTPPPLLPQDLTSAVIQTQNLDQAQTPDQIPVPTPAAPSAGDQP